EFLCPFVNSSNFCCTKGLRQVAILPQVLLEWGIHRFTLSPDVMTRPPLAAIIQYAVERAGPGFRLNGESEKNFIDRFELNCSCGSPEPARLVSQKLAFV